MVCDNKVIVLLGGDNQRGTFYGYNVKGGALDVGKASTNSVVASSILILLLDVLLTKLLLQ